MTEAACALRVSVSYCEVRSARADLLTDLVLLARAFFGYVSHRVARPAHEKLA